MEERDLQIAIGPGVSVLHETASIRSPSLEALYDQYAPALFRYAMALTGTAEDAEDAVGEVFVRVARERRFERIGNVKAYLYSAARNAAYSVLRSRRRGQALNDAISADVVSVGSASSGGAPVEATMLREALAELPMDQREVLILKVLDGMTFREIADTIGASINTVASRYRYGIDKLREALGVPPSP